MDLNSLAQLGRVEKEVEITKDLKVKFHTLSVVEQQNIFPNVPETVTDDARISYIQVAILTQAIDAVNGEPVDKTKLAEQLKNMQFRVLAELFDAYAALSQEQNTVIEELKKK